MKTIIEDCLKKLNETSFKIIRRYNPQNPQLSTWSVLFFNGGTFDFTYDNKWIRNGIVCDNFNN